MKKSEAVSKQIAVQSSAPPGHRDLGPRFYDRRGAAEYLQLSQRKVDQMIATGELTVVRFGKAVRIIEEDLWAVIEANRSA